ncbi:MAG: thioesterase family protein [Deltaproteobacteria bacterium]|nr:thioesterase family protein [Deltaproteobacteria bacterium]
MERDSDGFFSTISEMFNEKVPFHKLLGLTIQSMDRDRVQVKFSMRDELVGHYTRGMVHGGVISSIIDVTGGLAAFMDVQEKMADKGLQAKIEKFGRVTTIDLRVDFLRPGLGSVFTASAFSLRSGSKVAVTRIELKNEKDELIAVGTGSYTVG